MVVVIELRRLRVVVAAASLQHQQTQLTAHGAFQGEATTTGKIIVCIRGATVPEGLQALQGLLLQRLFLQLLRGGGLLKVVQGHQHGLGVASYFKAAPHIAEVLLAATAVSEGTLLLLA